MRKSILIVLAGLTIGAGLGLVFLVGIDPGILGVQVASGGEGISVEPKVGATAPDFELETLSGDRLKLSELRGKPVLINFWATWCGPCRLEMPAIEARYQRNALDLAVLAVNFDEPREPVQAYVDELGLSFTVLLDPGAKVQELYRVRGYPSTYVIDSDGIIRVQHIGIMTEEQLDSYLVKVGVGQ